MTLPASPPINLQQIYAQFGAPLGTSLTALVRGGAYVPNIAQNAGVPLAPPINLLHFLGAGSGPSMSIVPSTSNLNTTRGSALNQLFSLTGSGFIGPNTYAWSFVSGGANMTIDNPSAASINVSSSTTPGTGDIVRTAQLKCIATDTGAGNIQATAFATINWEWVGSGL